MDIVFTTIELLAIGVAVFIAKSITQDGSTNWYEGLLLLVVYIILGYPSSWCSLISLLAADMIRDSKTVRKLVSGLFLMIFLQSPL